MSAGHAGRAGRPGWLLLAMHDPTGRRGLWYRVTKDVTKDGDNVEAIEMCAGREGDDAYFKLRSQQTVDRTLIEEIASVLDYGLGPLMFAPREEPPAKS